MTKTNATLGTQNEDMDPPPSKRHASSISNCITFDDIKRDSDSVSPEDPFVFVDVPIICVNTDESHKDRPIRNLRRIRFSLLKKFANFGLEIDNASRERQKEIIQILAREQIELETDSLDEDSESRGVFTKNILDGIKAITEISFRCDIDDECKDVCGEMISFDPIRQFNNHPITNLLIDSPMKSWNGYVSYSQLIGRPDLINQARIENNDTDLNRAYFILKHCHRTMLFDNTKSCNSMIKMMNICMIFLSIVDNSTPAEGYSMIDIKASLVGFMIDVIVRSRVISKWRLSKPTKIMLSEIVYNYDPNNLMVVLLRLETAKERANFIVRTLAADERTKPLSSFLSYDDYEKKLKQIELEINGERYYKFGSSFITLLMTDSAIQNLMDSPGVLNDLLSQLLV